MNARHCEFDFMNKAFEPPSLIDIMIHCVEIELPAREGEKFKAYFDSVGWVVGKSRKPMKSWKGAMANWKFNWQDKQEIKQEISPNMKAVILRDDLKRIDARISWLLGQRPLATKLSLELTNAKANREMVFTELRKLI